MSAIEVVYGVTAPAAQIEARARAIAFEQTVELPEALVPDAVRETVVGRVRSIEPVEGRDDRFRVRVDYAEVLAAGQLPQLLNLVHGNASILPAVRLEELVLPAGFLGGFAGPGFGVDGLREMVGVRGRPLLATAIKPRGLALAKLAAIAGDFAAGGGDLVKDDQNLNDATFEDFRERVSRCAEAVAAANAKGGHCLYLPHVAATGEEWERRLEFVAGLGLRGVLAAPFLVGLDVVGEALRRHGLLWMAHPALTGSFTNAPEQGIDHGVLLGTLFRLAGADVSIFPNFAGRFSYSMEECDGIARALREPLGDLAAAWPCPAGGMNLARVPQMVEEYGPDTVLLIGGALLGHDPDLKRGTRAYLEAIETAARA